ncbi:MAG: nucleotidyl transferase AbiEii/AbiGii toxin family protein [Anaerolineaceae bacterium]|nr:nucleotidyl transferase AbiEii/AbiGii toxin family protein [Anaerolineaceae bacterium]
MKYKNAQDFRRALENRLGNLSKVSGMPHSRLRKLIAFDRFLARLFHGRSDHWVVKGGYAIQLRIGNQARTTNDIDLLLMETDMDILPALRSAGTLDLGDWFTFEISPAANTFQTESDVYRYFVQSRLDGRTFEDFHVDVGVGNPIIGKIEKIPTSDLLAFADFRPIKVPCYPISQQIAEKLHAYTRPRKYGTSSRVKDFVDILLFAELWEIKKSELNNAIHATFNSAGTHPVPISFPSPPKDWGKNYLKMIKELGMNDISLEEAYHRLQLFINPILELGTKGSKWNPSMWKWD